MEAWFKHSAQLCETGKTSRGLSSQTALDHCLERVTHRWRPFPHLPLIDLECIALDVVGALRRCHAHRKGWHLAASRHLPQHQAEAIDVTRHVRSFPA